MRYSTQVKPISYLKSHAAEIVKDLTERREPLLITQNGEARLVVMDVVSFEEQEQAMALLQILAGGRHDIEAGRTVPAADVFARIEEMDRDEIE